MNFYNVHCTNCGQVLQADRMAIDVDRIIKLHLSKIVGRSSKHALAAAKDVFDEVRVGMYLTKSQLANDGVLSSDGTLQLTFQYVLDHIGRRYQVDFDWVGKEKEESKGEDEEFLSVWLNNEEMFDSLDSPFDNSWEKEREEGGFEIPDELLDKLCLRMQLYAQIDNAEEEKRRCIRKMLNMLLKNREEKLLECSCKFAIQEDDRKREFFSALQVTYVDGETVAYNHMVCPDCGEPFFIDAGRYQEYIVVMLGSSRVGKTAYLAALVDAINPKFGQSIYNPITIKDTTDRKYTYFTDKILEEYRQGKKIIKTDESKDAVALFSLVVQISKEQIIILTFVDLPGEVFVPRDDKEKKEGEASGRFIINHRKICYSADVFWFCIDPVQIDQRLHRINDQAGSDRVEQDMGVVFGNIGNALNIMGNNKANAPTAIIITKSDLITEDAGLFFKSRELEPECLLMSKEGLCFRNDRFESVAANVRKYLTSNNVKNILPKLDGMFKNKNYFAVAAYGVEVKEGSEGGNKAPSGIILPFLWSLAVLGYLSPVEYMQKMVSEGLLGRPKIKEYYEGVERAALFDSKE